MPDGVGEDNNLPVRLRLGWHVTPQISLQLLGGVALAGELQLEDCNGNQISSADYDPAPCSIGGDGVASGDPGRRSVPAPGVGVGLPMLRP